MIRVKSAWQVKSLIQVVIQGLSKLLRLWGALRLRAMQTYKIQGRFCSFAPKIGGASAPLAPPVPKALCDEDIME